MRRACTAVAVLVAVVCQAAAPALPRLQVVALALNLQPPGASGEDDLTRTCRSWKLTESDVRQFFVNAVPISQADLHDFYYVLPCEYSGTMKIDGVQYEFAINGGAHGEIRKTFGRGELAMYGCRVRCAKLFPFGLYDDE